MRTPTVTRAIHTQTTTSTPTDYDIEVPYFYVFNPFPLIFTIAIKLIILAVISSSIFLGLLFILSKFAKYKYTCPNCKKTFVYKKELPKKCPYCHHEIEPIKVP